MKKPSVKKRLDNPLARAAIRRYDRKKAKRKAKRKQRRTV